MKVARQLLLLVLVACLVAPSFAQDDAKKKGKKNKNAQKGRNAAAQVFALPKGIEASDEQKASLAELKKEYGEKLQAATKKASLTADQRKAMAEARKSDGAKGKKGPELQAYVAKEAGLSDEQTAALKEANALRGEIRKKVLGLLTKEQRQSQRKNRNKAAAE